MNDNIVKVLVYLVLFLGGNNIFAQKNLSHQKAIEDIDFYIHTLKESHYEPFKYISTNNHDAHIQKIKQSIGDSIEIKNFVLLCYKITALLNDAHNTPQLGQPIFQDEFKKDQFFPYKLIHEKDKIYVPAKLSSDLNIPPGSEITSINGENISTLLKQVQEGIAGTQSFKEEVSGRLLCYFMFLENIKPPFIIGYRNENGIHQKAVINTAFPLKKALSASLPHIIKPYEFEILQNKLGYIDVRSLSGEIDSFRSFLDTCFSKIRKANINNIAIDLRNNSGGNTELGDLLFSYITDKKYSWGAKSWKISQPFKKYLQTQGDTISPYLNQKNGSVWESEICAPEVNKFKSNTIFKGNIYFITGPFTFSSAMAMVDVVKTYKIGTIIGEPPGELVMDFGEAFIIDLPNSHIKIQSTTAFSHGADCNRIQNGPVLTDIAVKNTLEDDTHERDKALEHLLQSIK